MDANQFKMFLEHHTNVMRHLMQERLASAGAVQQQACTASVPVPQPSPLASVGDMEENFEFFENSWNDYSKAIGMDRSPKRNVIVDRLDFFSAAQVSREPIDDFVTRLKAMAKFAKLGTLETDLIAYKVVTSNKWQHLKTKMLTIAGINLAEAVDLCRAEELTARRSQDRGRMQIQNDRNNRPQMQIAPKKINIPSNPDITARLGSVAIYQGWKNNSNMFAALNNEENQAAGGGAGGGMMDRDGDRDRRDRDRVRERSGSHNKISGSRDSYKKGSMERDRYNRYGSSNSQNDDRMSRSSREPSLGSMRPMSGQHSNSQMHDRDKLSSQQQSTIPGRSSQQRHIPQSTAPPVGKMGSPSAVRRNFSLPDEETETKLQKFSKTVNFEMDQSDIEASATTLKGLNIKPEFYHAAISQLFMDNIERDNKSRTMVAQVVANLMDKKVITKAEYLHALEEMFKLADDLIIDLPQLYKYVATFYVMLLNKRFITLVDVRNAAQDILPQYGATMLKELLLQYEALYGKDATVMLWYESSLNPTDFIKLGSPDAAEKYLTDARLGYLLDSSSKALDMQTFGTQIKHFLKTNAKFMDIYNWISGYVGPERETSDEFIRTLTKALIEHCMDGKTKLNLQEVQKWHQILQKYIDSKPDRELQALYAIQRLVVELEHPQNLLHSILEQLYELDVIIDGFHLWKYSTDPLEGAGKGVCLKEITQFMMIFMENSSDEDN